MEKYNRQNTEYHGNQICVEIVEKTNVENGKSSVVEMPWHYWYPEQLSSVAEKNGMRVLNFYGSFDKEPLDQDSDDLIFVISKK